MGRVAGHATLGLDCLMLKDKWSLLVNVACEADAVLRCRRAQLFADEPTVRVVAIRALNESLFHPMVERHVELRFDLLMTAVTQSRLRLSQQKMIFHSVVSRMATQAAQVVLAMS